MRRGRRPGDAVERQQAILAAARTLFAERGFDGASIRAVASAAGVDPALVLHYFGSKQLLFARAYSFELDPVAVVDRMVATPLAQRGRMMTTFYVDLFYNEGAGVAMLRSVASDSAAGTMVRQLIESTLLPAAELIAPGPNARLRVSLAAAHLMGAMFGRHIVGLGPLVEVGADDLIEALAPAVQGYLDGVSAGSP